MLRKKGLKTSVCIVLVMAMLLSFTSVSVLAADTKEVTVSQHYWVAANLDQYDSIYNVFSNTKYYYDDGEYAGTLTVSNINIYVAPWNYVPLYRFDIYIDYSGTVTSY